MKEQEIEIINQLGLHARAAAKLVKLAANFSSHIEIGREEQMVNAKSIMGVMMLAASKGTTVQLRIEGEDQKQAMTAITDLINDRFEEEQ